jgi:hypothetical protein
MLARHGYSIVSSGAVFSAGRQRNTHSKQNHVDVADLSRDGGFDSLLMPALRNAIAKESVTTAVGPISASAPACSTNTRQTSAPNKMAAGKLFWSYEQVSY